MKPIPIPDDMGIQGATKMLIKGGDTGASDVECLVGQDAEGNVTFYAMLVELDEADQMSLQRDGRFWVIQQGAPLHPHAFDTAFVNLPADPNDPTTTNLQELGWLLGDAWKRHAVGPPNSDAVPNILRRLAALALVSAENSKQSSALMIPADGGKRLHVVGGQIEAVIDGEVVGTKPANLNVGIRNARLVYDAVINDEVVGTVEIPVEDPNPVSAGVPLPRGGGTGDDEQD